MSEIADRYRRLAGDFAEKVTAVPDDRWSAPSPCPGWTARDVVRHVVETESMFLGFVERSAGEVPSVDDDPVAAWSTIREVVQAGLDDPALATASFQGMGGPTTFEAATDRFLCLDLLVHGWDLARAAGLDERLDLDEVRRVRADSEAFGDMLRGDGVCGPEVQVSEAASEQDRLLAYLGRQP